MRPDISLGKIRVTGLTLARACELLDWLENNGWTGPEVSCGDGSDIAVRCVCPPGPVEGGRTAPGAEGSAGDRGGQGCRLTEAEARRFRDPADVSRLDFEVAGASGLVRRRV